MGERLSALLLAPVLVVYLLLLKLLPIETPSGLRLKNLFLVLLSAIAFIVFEIYLFVNIGTSRLLFAYDAFVGRTDGRLFRVLYLIVTKMGIPLVSLGFFSGVYLIFKNSRAGLFLFVGAVIPPLIIFAFTPFFYTEERYVFVTLPCISCRAQNHRKLIAVGVLCLFVADAVSSYVMYYEINHGDRLKWREAFAYVQERKNDDDIIVSSAPKIGSYYAKNKIVPLEDIQPDIILEGRKRFWFVIDSELGWFFAKEAQWVEENTQLIDFQYLRVKEPINLRIYLYTPKSKKDSHK
jgi:hypothetical protein